MPGLDAHLDLVRLVQAHDQIYAGDHEQGRGDEPHQAPPLAGAILLVIVVVGHGGKIGTPNAPVKPRSRYRPFTFRQAAKSDLVFSSVAG